LTDIFIYSRVQKNVAIRFIEESVERERILKRYLHRDMLVHAW